MSARADTGLWADLALTPGTVSATVAVHPLGSSTSNTIMLPSGTLTSGSRRPATSLQSASMLPRVG